MSISSEITRLQNVKTSMKSAIEKRGVIVAENKLIDTFVDAIESAPYAIRGTFTPEEDTKSFSVGGLSFKPHSVYIVCNELYSANVPKSIFFLNHGKGLRGCCSAYDSSERIVSYLSENSPLATWGESDYEIDLTKSSGAIQNYVFKAGYTYEYYVMGGFAV